jgi:hypothetical protein
MRRHSVVIGHKEHEGVKGRVRGSSDPSALIHVVISDTHHWLSDVNPVAFKSSRNSLHYNVFKHFSDNL